MAFEIFFRDFMKYYENFRYGNFITHIYIYAFHRQKFNLTHNLEYKCLQNFWHLNEVSKCAICGYIGPSVAYKVPSEARQGALPNRGF